MSVLLPIDKIHRVAIVTDDLDGATARYSAFFGVPVWDVAEHGNLQGQLRGKSAGFGYRHAIGSANGVGFELIEPTAGDSAYSEYLAAHGPGISHVVVGGAGEVAEWLPRLAEAGIGIAQQHSAGAHDQWLIDTRERLGGLAVMVEKLNGNTMAVARQAAFDDPAVLPVQDLYQVAMMVNNLDQAKANFRQVLGIEDWVDIGIDTDGGVTDASYYGEPADHAARLSIGRRGEACFEVIEPLRGASIYQDAIDRHGETPHHVMVTICPPAQFAEAAELLAARGMPLSQKATIPGLMEFGYFDGREQLDGAFVEVIAPLSDDWLDKMFPSQEVARVVVGAKMI